MIKKIIVAIDGYSSTGKSTLARDLAAKLGYKYIDTGAMYRAVTYYLQEHHIHTGNLENVRDALEDIQIDFTYDEETGKQMTWLNGDNVEQKIRSMRVSEEVSKVSAIADVRNKMVEQQKKLGNDKGIVMDGRDIGTVVFPDAELKIFMTASDDVRIQRRFEELLTAGKDVDYNTVRDNLNRRDHQDTTRKESPLRKADDAVVLDNSNLSLEEQAHWAYQKVMEVLPDRKA